jgi:uncharacterized membrane protein
MQLKGLARVMGRYCSLIINPLSASRIDDSPYYVFVALCIVVIVVSQMVLLIKIAASNENIECFREYFAVGYRAPDPSFFNNSCTGQDKK